MKLSYTFAVLALVAAPAFAQTTSTDTTTSGTTNSDTSTMGTSTTGTMDAMTMTCAEMMKMDAQGMSSAGMAMKQAMTDNATVTAMTDEDATKAAEDACKTHPDGTVMDAMKAGKM